MKRCPNCNQIFSDENIFCLDDGTSLLDVPNAGQAPTVSFTPESSPTLTIPRQTADTANSSGIPGWLYAVLGAMAAIIIALGTAFFMNRTPAEKETVKNEQPVNSRETVSNMSQPNAENKILAPTMLATNKTDTNVFSPPTTPRPLPSINPNLTPGGNWKGDWSSSSGAFLTAEVNLTDTGAGQIQGEILWTLKRTVDPKRLDKIGYTATEYIRGKFNPSTRELSLAGYSKKDPDNVLANLDTYRLVLNQDNQEISGLSKNSGKWDGRFNLRRF